MYYKKLERKEKILSFWLDIEKEIMSWSKRNISTLGKITVVKSLLIPKITHLLISLPRPDKQMISKLEKILFKFIQIHTTADINELCKFAAFDLVAL